MKKGKLKLSISLSIFLIIISLVFANAQIIKTNKNKYNKGDDVLVLSTVSVNDRLCRSNLEEQVKLFIVDNRESWSGGESIDDVRENPSDIPNSRFLSKKVWEDSAVGNYDLIVDCNNNDEYDLEEPIFNEGFSVSSIKGIGKVSIGEKKIGDFSWSYDIEEPELSVAILQVKISAENENIKLSNLTIEFININLKLDSLEVYVDKNNNAQVDAVDVKIGEFFPESPIKVNQKENIPLDYLLNEGIEEHFIIVYKLNSEVNQGDYRMKLISLKGIGELTNEMIVFSGLPLESNKLTVLPKKSCSGTINLLLSPNPAPVNSEVVFTISNLTECDGRKVSIRSSPCNLPSREIGTCVLENGKCEKTIKIQREQTYYACLDKNSDLDFVDFGESIPNKFSVLVKELIVKTELKEGNEENSSPEQSEEDIQKESSVTTGKVVTEGLTANNPIRIIQNSDPILVLLEVTLLLILFVLVMILFKLQGTRVVLEPIEESIEFEEEKKEDEKEKKEEKKKKEKPQSHKIEKYEEEMED